MSLVLDYTPSTGSGQILRGLYTEAGVVAAGLELDLDNRGLAYPQCSHLSGISGVRAPTGSGVLLKV